jgi:hypothetical protein
VRRTFVVGCALLFFLLGVGQEARAQSGSAAEGAPDLIRPTGARSISMGLAVTAGATGGEAAWANPALVAWSPREVGLHLAGRAHAGDAESDAVLFGVIPWKNVGVLAVGLRYLDFGSQPVVGGNNPNVVGSFSTANLILSVTAATTFGRFATGFTLKQLRLLQPCTGECTQVGESSSPTASALDLGGQFFVRSDSTLSIGASVINIGPKFQIIDSPQADPIPGRGNLGVLYAPTFASNPDVRLNLAADVVTRLSSGTALGYRLGAEVGYKKSVFGRAGYMYLGPGEKTTPTVGFGVATAKLHIDFAQVMKMASTATNRPAYLSLRYTF